MEAIQAYQNRAKSLKEASVERRIRIINDLIGEYRIFQGDVVTADTLEAQMRTDADLLYDISYQYNAGRAIAFWADGSTQFSNGQGRCLGAGVVWQEVGPSGIWQWMEEGTPLGVDTGWSVDAELFAVAAALERAVACHQKGRLLDVVRIFSDCLSLLEDLRDEKSVDLGPALTSGWVLQNIYDCTDLLVDSGVSVQLVWQKGHAMSEGNHFADIAAKNAAQSQIRLPTTGRSVWQKKQDAPQGLIDLGPDSVDEWYWRMNRVLMLQGLEESEQVDRQAYAESEGSQGSADMDFSS